MHALIDKDMVETIHSTGKTRTSLPDRVPILQEQDLPSDWHAENVVMTGCEIFSVLPRVLSVMARLFDGARFTYTFLSKE